MGLISRLWDCRNGLLFSIFETIARLHVPIKRYYTWLGVLCQDPVPLWYRYPGQLEPLMTVSAIFFFTWQKNPSLLHCCLTPSRGQTVKKWHFLTSLSACGNNLFTTLYYLICAIFNPIFPQMIDNWRKLKKTTQTYHEFHVFSKNIR